MRGCEENLKSDFTGKRVLLVEDNEINREIANETLKNMGFDVECAEDGVIALNKIKHADNGDFDLILMDIQMPKMDGYSATREIRRLKDNPISKVPIISMSANECKEDIEEAMDSGMDEFIIKPIIRKDLVNILSRFFLEE